MVMTNKLITSILIAFFASTILLGTNLQSAFATTFTGLGDLSGGSDFSFFTFDTNC